MDLPLGADDVLASVGFGFHESLIARPSKEMLMHKCNLVLNTRLIVAVECGIKYVVVRSRWC